MRNGHFQSAFGRICRPSPAAQNAARQVGYRSMIDVFYADPTAPSWGGMQLSMDRQEYLAVYFRFPHTIRQMVQSHLNKQGFARARSAWP